jgi:hypothetical protein
LLFNKVIDNLQSLDGTYYLGDPWRLGEKGLTILVPIRCNAPPKRSYILASESKDKVSITDTGKIDELLIDNKSGSPVFIRGGTVFKGKSGQDRAVVQGVVVQPVASPEKSVPIVVKCVHAHRGIVTGGGFSIMEDLAPQEVYVSLQSRNQHMVWNAVADYSAKSARRLRTSVIGASYSANLASDPDLAETLSVNSTVRTDFSKQIMDALSKVPDYDDQVGVVVITVDGVQGLELFDSPESWKALGKEVVKSFSEIFHQDESIADLFTLNMEAVKDKVRKFLKELDGVTYRRDDGTFTIDDDTLVTCEYTNLNEQCIHIVVTKKAGNKYPKPQTGIPITPNIYNDMFEHDNQYRPYISPPNRYNMQRQENWINRDMDTTIVPPVKKPRIGDGLIFGRLMERSYSFNDLQSKTGIPSATLARRLNEYTDEGYILKTDEDGHAKWKLTAKGTVAASEKQN